MILTKFLKEWNGHSPENSTYQYVDEPQAEILIKKGIGESVDGTQPQRSFYNYGVYVTTIVAHALAQ